MLYTIGDAVSIHSRDELNGRTGRVIARTVTADGVASYMVELRNDTQPSESSRIPATFRNVRCSERDLVHPIVVTTKSGGALMPEGLYEGHRVRMTYAFSPRGDWYYLDASHSSTGYVPAGTPVDWSAVQ